jgi:glycerol-3-phosphate dehydrogenase
MIPKKVMESSICALAQQNSSRNNRYSSEKHSLEPILRNWNEFVLETAQRFLAKPTRADVLSVYAGLRPLAAPDEPGKVPEVSRSHKIIVSDTGLITITGGKWTTYRKNPKTL